MERKKELTHIINGLKFEIAEATNFLSNQQASDLVNVTILLEHANNLKTAILELDKLKK